MVAERVRRVELSGIRRMFENAPPSAINLGLGEPDFDPPKEVVAALCAAVENGMNHYGPTAGLAPLRDAIAERYRDRLASTARENVIVTGSGSEGLMTAALTLYDPGSEVLVPNPGFVLYAPHARLAGAEPVAYPLLESRRWQPDLDALERLVTPRTRAIVVNSPGNPTGGVYSAATVDRLVDFAERHQLTVVSDEVYDEIVYEGRPASFWGRSERVVVVQSFSKSLAMTGWRLGYLLAPAALAAELSKVHYHIMACPSTPAQAAALAGLRSAGPAKERMFREFAARRELVIDRLRRIPGVSVVPPAGAFYAFPRLDWAASDTEIAAELLGRGVITTPGEAFGTRGRRHLRISFAASRTDLRRGLDLLRELADEGIGRTAR